MTQKEAPKDVMVHLPGAEFLMGTDDSKGFPQDGEGSVRNVELHSFFIDPCAVTNTEFLELVEETGYETEASVSAGPSSSTGSSRRERSGA